MDDPKFKQDLNFLSFVPKMQEMGVGEVSFEQDGSPWRTARETVQSVHESFPS